MTLCFSSLTFAILAVGVLTLGAPAPSRAQEPTQFETALQAKRRVFENVGPGFQAIRRGPNGKYYILVSPSPAVQIYDPSGKQVGQIPSVQTAKNAALQFGESLDVDREGRVAVFDRAANTVKIYSSDGSLTTTIPVTGPASIALLPGDEIAVSSPNLPRLVTVYDLSGRLVRDYGDREEIASRTDVNRQVNLGHLATDDAGNTYFSFDYLPEPTMRKFDHVGYLTMEISLATLEFEPAAQSARRVIAQADRGMPVLHRILTAMGVDPQTQDVWLAIGTLLMHFNKDGQRLASYRTYTPRGARLEASRILVEPDRLLLGADPQGIYEFERPDYLPQQ
jgi:hypothetical protein